jgi:hypothetical protein
LPRYPVGSVRANKEANLLPAHRGKFHLMLRLYWPHENEPSILDGFWVILAVEKTQTDEKLLKIRVYWSNSNRLRLGLEPFSGVRWFSVQKKYSCL